ncbi:anthranilate phosphoribosyltransferase, partial [Candidatus Daviesbacteria bacterium]|nr:anthranilate phosphoribosyltransferase [Candidatus Daviesbacteria bacterium]
MEITDYLNLLIKKENLKRKQAKDLLGILMSEKTSPTQIAAILTALSSKGETAEEVAGFAQGMRELMLVVKVPKDAIDIVGTGGDGSNSF